MSASSDRRSFLRAGAYAALGLAAGPLALSACSPDTETPVTPGGGGATSSGAASASSGGAASSGAGGGGGKLLSQFPTLDNEYWQGWSKGGEQAAGALGIEFVEQTFGDDINQQLSQIETAASLQITQMYTFPQNAASSPQLYTQAAASKVYAVGIHGNQPWSTPLEPAFGGYFVTFFAPDNVRSSDAMCTAVFERIGGKGKVINLNGIPGNTSNIERTLGVDNALAKYPDIELVARENGGENRVDAAPVIENLLTANPDVNAIVCHNDDSAIAVLNALADRGLSNVLVGAIDGITEFLDAMQSNPNAAVTCAIHGPWTGGFAAVRASDGRAGITFNPVERMLYQDSLILDTPESAAEYKKVMDPTQTLAFDWLKMSQRNGPTDWNPQLGLEPIDPSEYWGRLGAEVPAGYSLPAEYQAAIDAGDLQKYKDSYRALVTESPLTPVIALTGSKKSVLGLTV
jgi:ribose transport system substrate-binding protein